MEKGPESKAQSRGVASWKVREVPKHMGGKKNFQRARMVLGSIQRDLDWVKPLWPGLEQREERL